MIKNAKEPKTDKKFFNENVLFGFAIDDQRVNRSLVETEFFLYRDEKTRVKNLTAFDCYEEVFRNLSQPYENFVPKNLRIYCVKISTDFLAQGWKPTIMFHECMDVQKGCQPLKIRKKLLDSFKIWAFGMTDVTDFWQTNTNLNSNFTGYKIPVSRKFSKNVNVKLQELEVMVEKGLFVKKREVKSTLMVERTEQNIFSLDEEEKVILRLQLEVDNLSKRTITKKFKSLMDVLAYLGGVSKGVSLFFLILVLPVREVLFYRKLINYMFSVCCDERQIEIALSMQMRDDETESGSSMTQTYSENSQGENFQGKNSQGKNVHKGRRGHRSKGIKAQLKKFKRRIKVNNKNDQGLIEAISKGMLTKEAIFDNLKAAFTPGDQEPRTFTDMMRAGMKRTTERYDRDPLENFVGGVLGGEMKELDEVEMEILGREMISRGVGDWLGKVKKKKNGGEEELENEGVRQEERISDRGDAGVKMSKFFLVIFRE